MKQLLIALTLIQARSDDPWARMPPPEAYIRPIDQQRARLRDPEHIPCVEIGHEHGYEVNETLPTDACVNMLPAQRIRGVWQDEFESSEFYPNAANCKNVKRRASIWLTPRHSGLKSRYSESGYSGRVLIDAIARRTKYAGFYGHMGLFDHELIVDRVISARVLDRSRNIRQR